MRLFVAIELPEDVLRLVEGLPRPNLPKLRWTTREQWHVTLRFLGEVADPGPVAEALTGVSAALRQVSAEEVEVALGPAVAWFTGRRILQVPVTGAEVLADVVIATTASFGEPPEPGPFTGHLTLARVRGPGKGPANLAGTPVRASWKVDEIALVSSTLGTGGAHYEILEKLPLGWNT